MDQEVVNVSWKKFFVRLAGKTNDAHHAIVAKFKAMGQTEVYSDEESDYLLVFCPIASRVGTDISEALDKIPGDKPVILVVMHHTFDGNRVVTESRRLVNNPNVYLTVDWLFYEGNLLNSCNRNDIASAEVLKFFGVSTHQVSHWSIFNSLYHWSLKNWKIVLVGSLGIVVLLVISIVLAFEKKNKKI